MIYINHPSRLRSEDYKSEASLGNSVRLPTKMKRAVGNFSGGERPQLACVRSWAQCPVRENKYLKYKQKVLKHVKKDQLEKK